MSPQRKTNCSTAGRSFSATVISVMTEIYGLTENLSSPSTALERCGFEVQSQFLGGAPGVQQLASAGPAGDLGVLDAIVGAGRIAEIIGMELRHDVHRRGWHVAGDPVQHRTGAARYVIGHHQMADGEILAPS